MAVMDIVTLPDPILREQSAPVERVDDDLRRLVENMFETMYDAPGIGLAGIQVGVRRRLFTLDCAKEEGEKSPICMINPEIIWSSDEISTYEEGCLSIPEYYAEVDRPAEIKIKFLDQFGKDQELMCDGLLATCAQHELDHLNGALFIDYISKLRRDRVIKKFTKLAKQKDKGVL
ncbi:peptide deformylase [Cohaesibacter celericrescens]|uniref:Peptide deformylase n=1 Tax=Cohaesibacter celericrescens TaxID=2067669 RepID=A0A2N5XN83_9HYPH|nr:peptide deformylase [Cohaesibacter celericrescens]PLW76016.1 peptide deformylase [Cohaesibacter celericrescens]